MMQHLIYSRIIIRYIHVCNVFLIYNFFALFYINTSTSLPADIHYSDVGYAQQERLLKDNTYNCLCLMFYSDI